MSNDKQNMKLYTTDQVIDIFEKYGNMSAINARNIIDLSESIELPSDKDITHLQWIYDRMSNVHGENENYDYMLKFKEIIEQLKKVGNNEQK